jgi:hypothetical protein
MDVEHFLNCLRSAPIFDSFLTNYSKISVVSSLFEQLINRLIKPIYIQFIIKGKLKNRITFSNEASG